ncbi:glucan 1,3-beta-glucosidase [Verticillium alfalfae VaMs.102]|uniref:Probable glucan endo-1,3-beta-glucosidase eglC n=1 Tax=Verticillium alfalfae (strain VaMs.102 / ATCC MYA-4576 / FGSC 10136) TaxID=526221 RepID=C9S7Q8_VERA1|nr:glucan 1,3-beta-glucosidase [Verticillium alfalfae VaMs.102]EEY14793.1 glucan 1,3-beta-glucosidase [Verticillium alfalfae VaMs.102]
MRSFTSGAALLAAVQSAQAAFQGFNYGNVFTDGRPKSLQDFTDEFETAQNLEGTNGAFNSARLYTMVQAGTTNDPIAAIQAAIDTRTSLLLGLWASAGSEAFSNEIAALRRTIEEYGDQLDGLVAGISIGSEDLYRNSPTGIAANENPGANPNTLVDYFNQVRDVIEGTSFAAYPLGHVDTWNAWDNSSNQAVIDASDWIGFDAYAYFEETQDNDISNGKALFDRALQRTRNAVGSKPIWITETGWPTSGDTVGNAVPSPENAEIFYQEVGCPLFGETNTWWYSFRNSPGTPNPSFGVIGPDLTTQPLYDLSCDAAGSASSSSTVRATTAISATASTATAVAPGPTTTVVAPIPGEPVQGDEDEHTAGPAPIETSEAVPAPVPSDASDDHDGDDNGEEPSGGVPAPVPVPAPTASALSSVHVETTLVGSTTLTHASVIPTHAGNETVPAPEPTSTEPVEVAPGSASSMSFSGLVLAAALAVALF